MPVKAISNYSFESRSRSELYGDDQLVNVWWVNAPMMCAAACFRAPREMAWSDFLAAMVYPWASSDPGFEASRASSWQVDGVGFSPDPSATLASLGVRHKSLVSFKS